jgi:hypothetical protein
MLRPELPGGILGTGTSTATRHGHQRPRIVRVESSEIGGRLDSDPGVDYGYKSRAAAFRRPPLSRQPSAFPGHCSERC